MKKALCFLYLCFTIPMTYAQFVPNYEESKVPEFQLPDLLTTFDGEQIGNADQWVEKRRPELLQYFESQIYGAVPGALDTYSFKVLEQDNEALGGKARRKQVAIHLEKNGRPLDFTILLYLPKSVTNAPVFLGYNFHGNHTITTDPNVLISKAWSNNNENLSIDNNTLTEASRGMRTNRWAIEKIIDGGFGLATIYYGEVDPDKNDLSDGIHALFYEAGQLAPKANEWGSIAAWAFGLSRAMDYITEDIDVDANKVIVFGHSRLGKAALWAGATDNRFAGVISNESGCGGAALSKRKFGETVGRINRAFPHWFCDNFDKFNEKEEALQVDQHGLLALIAPRPLYVASAAGDEWSDPKGEYLSAYHASAVYRLFGKEGIPDIGMPQLEQPIQNTVAYHNRSGDHDVTDYDWEQYIAWAKTF
mgnify:CR=1 FL=1|tara:strand:- start:2419 stop:3678 length:1260 start_codon:yes stop_codon:yes gene_type:complete